MASCGQRPKDAAKHAEMYRAPPHNQELSSSKCQDEKVRNPCVKAKDRFLYLVYRNTKKDHGGPIWILEATYTTSGCISLSHLLRSCVPRE